MWIGWGCEKVDLRMKIERYMMPFEYQNDRIGNVNMTDQQFQEALTLIVKMFRINLLCFVLNKLLQGLITCKLKWQLKLI